MRATYEGQLASVDKRRERDEAKVTMHQIGAHRGGTDYANLFVAKRRASGQRRPVAVEIWDRRQGRPQTLAKLYEREGIPVTAHEGPAPVESNADIVTIAIDDAQDTASAVSRPVTSDVLNVGILSLVPTLNGLGGSILGIGATITRTDTATHQKACAMFDPLAAMAPERTTSRNITRSPLNAIQMPDARTPTHDRLTTNTIQFLDTGEGKPDLFVVSGLSKRTYSIDVIDAPKNTPRRELVSVATHDLVPEMSDFQTAGRGGVVFFDPREAWLYFVLCNRSNRRWPRATVDHAVEIPVQALPPLTLPNIEPTPKSEPTFLEMLVTD